MIHLRLSDVDRDRLGAPEWLDVDPHTLTVREASILQRGFDLDGERVGFEHPGKWRQALHAGERIPPEHTAMLVLVWLGLRRADVFVPLAQLDFNLDELAWRQDPIDEPEPDTDPGASPGKDDEPPTPPPGSEPSETSPA